MTDYEKKLDRILKGIVGTYIILFLSSLLLAVFGVQFGIKMLLTLILIAALFVGFSVLTMAINTAFKLLYEAFTGK